MHREVIEGFRLSPQQKRLWLLQRQDGLAYRAHCALRFEGAIDIDLLKNSLFRLVERHEALRTTFRPMPGIKLPVQVVRPGDTIFWREIDLGDDQSEPRIEEFFGQERIAPFDLESGPTARFTLLRFSPQRHTLLMTLPSLCADERTLQNMAREIGRIYQARLKVDESLEEALAYVRFSEWQNDLLESDDDAAGVEFWRDLDPGTGFALTLPLEKSPLCRGAFAPEAVELVVEAELAARITTSLEACGRSPEVFLLACWQTLLWRLTGEREIVVNLHCDGRVYDEMQDALGLYARWLPARHSFIDEMRFSDALDQIDRYVSEARCWQEYFSWDRHAGADWAATTETGPPISFIYEEWPRMIEAGDLRISLVRRSVCADLFKLRLSALRNGDRLAFEFQYDSNFYQREMVERLGREFVQLLKSALSDMELPVGHLGLIDELERDLMVIEWNRTTREIPSERCLHQLFEEQVERAPDAIAVNFQGESLSYGELNMRANRLGHHLLKLGIGPESRVALLMERSVEMLVGVLGALKAGAAYVPLDPAQPGPRMTFMLEDARAQALLTQEGLRPFLPDCACPIVWLDSDSSLIAQGPETNPEPAVTPDNLAYVIYTSGSSGKPKGVMIRHRSVVNLLPALRETVYPESKGAARVSLNAPLAFDSSVKQVFQLLLGHQICIVPEEVRRDGDAMLSFIERESLDVLDCTPSQLRLLLEAGLMERGERGPALSLVGGEAIDRDLWAQLARLKSAVFHNLYGPTECTVDATTRRIPPDSEVPTIGRPLANIRVYILDRRQNPVPIGVPGELHIGGAGLSRGYLERPDLTGEKFIPSPIAGSIGERIYRTGDLARYLADGEIEFLGRIDHQVKIRGSRIELGEIEAVIQEHPDVNESVVIAREDAPGDKRLVAYVIPVKGKDLSARDLSGFLRRHVPEYMTPAAFMILNHLPLTPNGKIDRLMLPPPEQKRPNPAATNREGGNAIKELLASIFAGVLGLEAVGPHDNFFELGGHSLIATQVTSRIRQTFRVEAPLRSIFENPTVEALSVVVETALRAGRAGKLPPLRPFPREKHLPLSFAQQRLWFLDQFAPNSPLYNIPYAVKLEGRLDIGVLERAINEIVRRHEALRTRFEVKEGEPAQVIDAWERRDLEVEDLTSLTLEERGEEVKRKAREEAETGFDLSRGPLLRVKVLKLGEEEHALLFTMHHIVSDGWSTGILIREVGELYRAYSAGEESPLEELPIQYADFAVWQRAYLAGGVFEGEVGYWKERLKDAAVMELPADYARPAIPSHRGGWEVVEIGKELSQELRRLSQREGATLFMTLMAAFKVVLMRHSGAEDVSVGTVIANRTRREVEGLIGFFVNTLVMRTDLSGNPSFRELVKREREVALGAYAHQEAPFEKLVEEINPERDLSRSPLFQVMMALQNTNREELEMGGLELSWIGAETGAAKFDLTLMLKEEREVILGFLEYSRDLYDGETIRRMARRYEKVLREIVRDAGRRIREIELLSEMERREIVEEWNETQRGYGGTRLAHEMIADCVERSPEAIAVMCGEEQISYCGLNERANRLARYLRGLGVGPEVIVGLCLGRSVEMVVGLLGILKAGGAYLPLDPDYPGERLEFMLKDAGVKVVVSERRLLDRLVMKSEGAEPRILCLDEERAAIELESAVNPDNRVLAENLAYMIYTSGSTGRPKGVMVNHGGLANYLQWATESYRIGEGEGAPVQSSIGFDLTVTSLYGPLVSGKRAHLLSEEEGIEALATALSRERGYSLVKITPTHLELLSQQMEKSDVEGRVRTLVIGGEELRAAGLKYWQERALGTRLINEYGPTETVVGCCVYEFDGGESRRESVPIGKPIANTQMYVLDTELEPVPVGVRGEIYISGLGLARGYAGRPELTGEKFIPNRFSGKGGERLYRTGDVGRYLSGGNIEFVGRADDQVKIRGYRIELGEIQAVLDEHQLVRQSVVVASEGERGGKRLLGYVVGEEGAVAAELKRHLRERLPKHMIPEDILMLEAMPITENGKIDRKRLPSVKDAGRQLEQEYVGARTPVEEIVAGIFEEVLRLDRVGIHDNFFEIGGHSLLATRLVSQVREDFQIEVPVRALFEAPTVASFAKKMAGENVPADYLEGIAATLKELRDLSNDEVAALLSEGAVQGRS